MYKQIVLLAAAQLVLTGSAWAQQNPVQWGDATAEKMSRFLPKPTAALIPRTPWGGDTDNKIDVWSGYGLRGGNQQFYPAGAEQLWAFDDPKLFEEVAAAQKDRAGFDQARLQDLKSHMAERNALQTQARDLFKKGQTKEALALLEKMKAAGAPYEAKRKELDERVRTLQRGARSLHFRIVANAPPYHRIASAAERIGWLAGHPLYRANSTATGYRAAEFVNLAVYLGPPGFDMPSASKPELKIKCILVYVEVASSAPHPDTIKADEAVARQMLEKVDYAGLVRLMEP